MNETHGVKGILSLPFCFPRLICHLFHAGIITKFLGKGVYMYYQQQVQRAVPGSQDSLELNCL